MPADEMARGRALAGPGDVVIMFDYQAWVDGSQTRSVGGGGTYAPAAVNLARAMGCDHLVLVSDGVMSEEQIAMFDEVILSRKPPVPGPYSGT